MCQRDRGWALAARPPAVACECLRARPCLCLRGRARARQCAIAWARAWRCLEGLGVGEAVGAPPDADRHAQAPAPSRLSQTCIACMQCKGVCKKSVNVLIMGEAVEFRCTRIVAHGRPLTHATPTPHLIPSQLRHFRVPSCLNAERHCVEHASTPSFCHCARVPLLLPVSAQLHACEPACLALSAVLPQAVSVQPLPPDEGSTA